MRSPRKSAASPPDEDILERLVFEGGSVSVMAGQDGDATASEALDATVTGAPLSGANTTLAFKPQFLTEALHALDTQDVQFGINHPAKPVQLVGSNAGGELLTAYLHLLVPIRLQG